MLVLKTGPGLAGGECKKASTSGWCFGIISVAATHRFDRGHSMSRRFPGKALEVGARRNSGAGRDRGDHRSSPEISTCTRFFLAGVEMGGISD